jgi:leucyl aminopeptidase
LTIVKRARAEGIFVVFFGKECVMQIEVKPGRIELAQSQAALLGCFEEVRRLMGSLKAVDEELSGSVARLLETGDFSGKLGQTAVLYPQGRSRAERIILVGLGKKNDLTVERLRRAYGFAGRRMRELKVENASLQAFDTNPGGIKSEQSSQAMLEGILLSHYRLDQYKSGGKDEEPLLQRLTIMKENRKGIGEIKRGAGSGEIFSWATTFTRDLANHPSNYLTPTRLAQQATELARENNLKCTVLSQPDIKKLKMNAFLAVAAGSKEPPRLILLEYAPAKKAADRLALVGKGITFDSGGLSLKPMENMLEMKGDMMGGAVVISVVAGCAKLRLPLHVIGIVPASENLPSGSALKIGDIITSHSGKTVEVLNTDAEGRLLLADGLSYAQTFKPDAIVDVATLTGSIKIALGTICAGIFGNNQRLNSRMVQAGQITGERVWEMPLWDEYADYLKSDLADIKNVGGRPGGSILAAKFLQTFVGGMPWVHLDLAGVDFREKEESYHSKGATGFGARLLLQFLKDWK